MNNASEAPKRTSPSARGLLLPFLLLLLIALWGASASVQAAAPENAIAPHAVFDDIQGACSDLLNATSAECGWILGGSMTGTLCMAFLILSAIVKSDSAGPFVLFSLAIGPILSVGFGWWDPWTIVFSGLFLAIIAVDLLKT